MLDLGEKGQALSLHRHTTSDVAEAEKFDFFCQSICEVYTGITPERSSAALFQTEFEMLELGEVVLGVMRAPGHKAVRGRRELNRHEDDHVFLNYQDIGNYYIDHQGTRRLVHAGRPVLIDNAKSFELEFDPKRRMNLLSIRLPRKIFSQHQKKSDFADLNENLDRGTEAVLIRQQLRLLGETLCLKDLNSAQYMAYSTIHLLMRLIGGVSSNFSQFECDTSHNTVEALIQYARRHLTEPELSIEDLAGAFGCSVRTIQSRFANKGLSFSRWLMQERLRYVAYRLRSTRREDQKQIANLSAQAGFRDLSTFYKAFKQEFGQSPRQWQCSIP